MGEVLSIYPRAVNCPIVHIAFTGPQWVIAAIPTSIHPVCDISSITTSFKLVGGGGTDFAPIIAHIAEYRDTNAATPPTSILPIILTDGYAPLDLDYDTANPLLWVVSPGGIRSEDFPYGDVARIEGP